VNTRQIIRLLSTTVLLLWSLNSIAASQYSGPNRDASGNIVPTPKGEKCVEPTADMRANHMKYLLHKRDKTMYEGIRTEQHSLVECINCHVTPGADGKISRVFEENNQHFCSTCHVSASVKLDCFECHADRPVEAFSQSQAPAQDLLSEALDNSIKPHVAYNRKVQ